MCKVFIHKLGFAIPRLHAFVVLAGWFGKKLPTSFLPDEDQGYVFVAEQLPDAASLQRSSTAAKRVEEILLKTPGVAHVASVIGYGMLSGVQNIWVTFKPWSERKASEEQDDTMKAHINRELRQVPEGVCVAFPPPAAPGVGTSGGVTYVLEDRSGRDAAFLAANTQRYMAEVRKRPEIPTVFSTAALFSDHRFTLKSIATRCWRKV